MSDSQQPDLPRSASLLYELCPSCAQTGRIEGTDLPCACKPLRVQSTGVTLEQLDKLTEVDRLRREQGISSAMLKAGALRGTVERLKKLCPGNSGYGEKCCERAGDYNGFGSDGPTVFTCPKGCSCHD